MNSPALTAIDLPLKKLKSGKVREVYKLANEQLLMVTTDRLSAFDCVLPDGIPGKGRVLNQLSAWWFQKMAPICPNHFITTELDTLPPDLIVYRKELADRSMIVHQTKVIPFECVVRGYLLGSAWKEYTQTRTVCGNVIHTNMRLGDKLSEPLFTPSTKSATGHDENINFTDMARKLGQQLAEEIREISLDIYRHAAAYALTKGIIIADTKFEFGLDEENSQLLLIDELLTPDSSRFWDAKDYKPGTNPPSFDKQYVRDFLEKSGWNKNPPAPRLPAEVIATTAGKYRQAAEKLTGQKWE